MPSSRAILLLWWLVVCLCLISSTILFAQGTVAAFSVGSPTRAVLC